MSKRHLIVKTYLGIKGKDYIEATLLQEEETNATDDENVIAIAKWEKDGYYFVRKIRKPHSSPKKIVKKRFRLPSYSMLHAFIINQLEEFAGVHELSLLDQVSWKIVTKSDKSSKDVQVTEKDHLKIPPAWTEPLTYVLARARHVQQKALMDETFLKNMAILNFIQQGKKQGRSLNSISKYLNKDKKTTRKILSKLKKRGYLRQDERGWYHVTRTPQSIDDIQLLHQDFLYLYKDPNLRITLGVLLGALTAEMFWTWWPKEGKVFQTQYDGKGNIVSEILIDTPYDRLDFGNIAQELAKNRLDSAYLVDDGSRDPTIIVRDALLKESIDQAVNSLEYHYGILRLFSVIWRPIFAGVKCTSCNLHFVVFPYPEKITKKIMGEDMAYKHVDDEKPAFDAESFDFNNVECLCGARNPELLQRPMQAPIPEPLEAAVEEAHHKYDEFLKSSDLDWLQQVAEYHRVFLKISDS